MMREENGDRVELDCGDNMEPLKRPLDSTKKLQD